MAILDDKDSLLCIYISFFYYILKYLKGVKNVKEIY